MGLGHGGIGGLALEVACPQLGVRGDWACRYGVMCGEGEAWVLGPSGRFILALLAGSSWPFWQVHLALPACGVPASPELSWLPPLSCHGPVRVGQHSRELVCLYGDEGLFGDEGTV